MSAIDRNDAPPPEPSRCRCGEPMPTPTFDPRDASEPAAVVQQRSPRIEWRCPRCGTQTILYASFEHYIAGDW